MKIQEITIENYRGIKDPIVFTTNNFNCIVGKNDVGKSTLLKAMNMFFNDASPNIDDKNVSSESNLISVKICFDCHNVIVDIDGGIQAYLESEKLTDEKGYLCIHKQWDISQKTIKPSFYIKRKKYEENDFMFLDEKGLIKLCKDNNIETTKGNGDEYNNKEKRGKLREIYESKNYSFSYEEELLPTTGQTRQKKLLDSIKSLMPSFEYFKADNSLSDSDTSIQKYFKEKALTLIREKIDTSDVESQIKEKVSEYFDRITNKINKVLLKDEKVEGCLEFDWSKLISTSFRCSNETYNIPLNSRGDGFRRITMMSYFEMLAEEKDTSKTTVYGFEEPETFLHPEVQLQLCESLLDMASSGNQVFITTHSPIIVSEANKNDIIYISRGVDKDYILNQDRDIDLKSIVNDLGIKGNESIFNLYSDTKCLFLVEGPDDVKAMNHLAKVYKENDKIESTFSELGVTLIPVGGCSAIKHWENFQIIKNLGKPYFIMLDSDKENINMESPNLKKLLEMDYITNDCCVTKKREIENYIPCSYINGLGKDYEDINYGDWDDVKDICKKHPRNVQLGGKKVCEYHFNKLSFKELRQTFCPSGKECDDEFLQIYNKIKDKIKL